MTRTNPQSEVCHDARSPHLARSLATLPALQTARAQTATIPAPATPEDPRMTERAIGCAEAKVTVQQYFSLTCTHCAAFQKETFPRVKAELIDTSKIRYIWRDYPLTSLATSAAMIARALPELWYEPFITSLLMKQDRWTSTRMAIGNEELMNLAAQARMSKRDYEKALGDPATKDSILSGFNEGRKKYNISSTPTFVINDKALPGAVAYNTFLKAVEAASSA